MKYLLSFLLFILIILLLSIASWRWFYLGIKTVDTVDINHLSYHNHSNQSIDIDELLKKYLSRIAKQNTLLAQFKQKDKTIYLDNLQIDQCEVSQGEFARFANWQAFFNPTLTIDPQQPKDWTYYSQTAKHKILGKLDTPLGGVSFFDAFTYCHAAGGRLPSSEEFEAISRSQNQQLYPWGNHFIKDPWRYYDPVLNISEHCGVYQKAKTIDGIYDLGNNVSEWTIQNNQAILMGGNAYQRPVALYALALIKRDAPKDFRSQYSGFRCVYNLPAPTTTTLNTAQNIIKEINPSITINTKQRLLPWKGSKTIISVKPGSYTIGMPKHSKIAKLLRALEKNNAGSYKDNINVLTHLANQKTVPKLRIMRFETTVAEYQKFLADPIVRLGFYNHKKQPNTINHKPSHWQRQQQTSNQPVVGVSWWSAWAFSKWVGGRLPSASEWQTVASHELTLFPYGNYYQQGRGVDRLYVNNKNNSKRLTHPLSIYASNDGGTNYVLGLSGNVAEWTNTTVLKGPSFLVVIKGGSYLMPALGGQISQSGEAPPNYTSDDVGFRVVFK